MYSKETLSGLPLALLIDHGGVLDGAGVQDRLPAGHIMTGQYKDGRCMIPSQSISKRVIESLILRTAFARI